MWIEWVPLTIDIRSLVSSQQDEVITLQILILLIFEFSIEMSQAGPLMYSPFILGASLLTEYTFGAQDGLYAQMMIMMMMA